MHTYKHTHPYKHTCNYIYIYIYIYTYIFTYTLPRGQRDPLRRLRRVVAEGPLTQVL